MGILSDVAGLERLAEPLHQVAFGTELMAYVEFEARGGDGTADAAVVEFLVVVHVAPIRVAGSVEVSDELDVLAEGADHVTLHDLHVVDVVEQLRARAANTFDDIHAPARV